MLLRKPLAHHRCGSLSLSQTSVGTQSAEHEHAAGLPVRHEIARRAFHETHAHRQESLDADQSMDSMKALGRDAYDGHGVPIHGNLPAHDSRISAVASLPVCIAQNDNWVRPSGLSL